MESRKSFLLRIDPVLWSELEAWAADELRSINGQVEYLLREAVAKRRGTSAAGKRATAIPKAKPAAPKPDQPPPQLTNADSTDPNLSEPPPPISGLAEPGLNWD